MKKIKCAFTAVMAFVLTVSIVLAFPVFISAESVDLSEFPRVLEMTFDEIVEFYSTAEYDEMLSDKLCIAEYDVTLDAGDYTINCEAAYTSAIKLKNVANMSVSEIFQKLDPMLKDISDGLKGKYFSVVTKSVSYNCSISGDGVDKEAFVFITLYLNETPEQRNEIIETFVRPKVAEWSNLSDAQKIVNLNKFMLNGQFRYDMNLENRKSVYEFVRNGLGVCEEYAGLTKLFLDEMGLENIIITGVAMSSGDVENHAWNMVRIGSMWYHLDILWNGPVNDQGEHQTVTTDYLLKSSKTVWDHQPDTSFKEYSDKALKDYYFSEPDPSVITPQDRNYGNYSFIGDLITGISDKTAAEEFLTYLNPYMQEYGYVLDFQAAGEFISTGETVNVNDGKDTYTFKTVVRGDLDSDGKVTLSDAVILLRIIAKLDDISSYDSVLRAAMELDGNYGITMSDCLPLLQYVANLKPSL